MTHYTNTTNSVDFPLSELDQDAIQMYGKPLTGKYKHYCCEFDYLPIDEHSFEFKFCDCWSESDDAEEIQSYKDKIILP